MQRRMIVKMAAMMLVLGVSLLLDMGVLFAADKAPGESGAQKALRPRSRRSLAIWTSCSFLRRPLSTLKISSRWQNQASTTGRSFIE